MFSIIMLFWYIFPVVVLFACNYIVSMFSLTERFKIRASDMATPFLFIGLNMLSKDSFGQSIVPYTIISVLLLGICIAVFQAYYYGEILYGHYLKMFWRFVFLISVIWYIMLILLNILHYLA